MPYIPPSPPGTLITIHADVAYAPYGVSALQTAPGEAYMGVLSRLAALLGRPVYLCGQWRQDNPANGAGMIVRVLHKNANGEPDVLTGLQLLDGRVLVGQQIFDRDQLCINYLSPTGK